MGASPSRAQAFRDNVYTEGNWPSLRKERCPVPPSKLVSLAPSSPFPSVHAALGHTRLLSAHGTHLDEPLDLLGLHPSQPSPVTASHSGQGPAGNRVNARVVGQRPEARAQPLPTAATPSPGARSCGAGRVPEAKGRTLAPHNSCCGQPTGRALGG